MNLRMIFPLLALASGVGTFTVLKAKKPEPEKKAVQDVGTLVEVVRVDPSTEPVVVHAQGSVVPAEQVVLQPEVTGRILWRADSLVPGGLVRAGELLVRLDGKSASLALEQQEAQVNRAELDLQLEASRKEIAEREWAILNKKAAEASQANPLAVRDPQLKTAAAQVQAAKSARDAAKLNVSRTALVAPFNAFVQRASADRGQLVSPSSQIATLIGIDRFWVQISVPLETLSWIHVPGISGGEGSEATVVQEVGADRIVRKGHLVRLLGDLDPVGRMARVLVEIEDPFGVASEGERGLPLLVGAFVDVQLDGGELQHVFRIPRTALRDGDHVYVMREDGKLEVRDIGVAWRTPDAVLVREGLSAGDRVVTSRLGSAVAGMSLRLAAPESRPEKAPELERK
jgi:RND family efflux transporter MFP subunit